MAKVEDSWFIQMSGRRLSVRQQGYEVESCYSQVQASWALQESLLALRVK